MEYLQPKGIKGYGFLVCADHLSEQEWQELRSVMPLIDITQGVTLSTGKRVDYVAGIVSKTAEC